MCEKYLADNHSKKAAFSKFKSFSTTVSLSPKGKAWYDKATRNPGTCEPLILEMSAELLAMEEQKPVTISIIRRETPSAAAAAAPVKKLICVTGDTVTAGIEGFDDDEALDDESKLDPREEELKGELYKQLMVLRNKIADNEGIAPYMVFSNKNLLDIAVHRPASLKTLGQIEGITAARSSKFGQQMVDFVVSFCKDNQLHEDSFETVQETQKVNLTIDPRIRNLKTTAQETYKMCEIEDKSMSKVATERGLVVSTIFTHLTEAMQAGLYVNLNRMGVTKEIFETVAKVICSPPINNDVSKLTPIKQMCPDYIEFNHIKVVICALKNKYGVEELPATSNEESASGNSETSSGNKSDKSRPDADAPSQLFKRKFENNNNFADITPSASKRLNSNKLFKM